MRARIAGWLDAFGPRPSCGPSERALGASLVRDWSAWADETRSEAFTCHPLAFLGSIAVASVMTVVAWGLVPLSPLASVLVAVAALAVVWLELVRYHELIDPLFPAAEGVNVMAVVRPTGPVRRRLLLTAHQDSAWEFNVWYWFGSAGLVVNGLGLLAPVVPLVLGVNALLGVLSGTALWAAWGVAGLTLAPVVVAHVLFHTFRPVPGAMDDLAGIAVLEAATRSLATSRLAGTELVLLACSAEECGLRGAKRWAERHGDELAAVPTYDINVDGVYDEQFLSVVAAELSTSTRHDPALTAEAVRIAADLGARMRTVLIPFGGTDAAALSHAGVRTVALLCQDTDRLAPNYHTRRDTLDHVRPEALHLMATLVEELARRIDAGSLDRG